MYPVIKQSTRIKIYGSKKKLPNLLNMFFPYAQSHGSIHRADSTHTCSGRKAPHCKEVHKSPWIICLDPAPAPKRDAPYAFAIALF